ncbi:MAG: ribose 5-phosphate isomerase B [Bryobacteraceae bacterium]
MRAVVTEADVPSQGELWIAEGSIVTMAAREKAAAMGVRLVEAPAGEISGMAPPARTVAIGSDHGGFRLKQELLPVLASCGVTARDVGVHAETPADYPDIAVAVADLVAGGAAARGIVVDGAGIGSSMAANKVAGVRASLCWDQASAKNAREHNDANVLTLGGRLLTASQAEAIVRTWLATPFAGGRHQARVDKIMAIEERGRS